MTDSTTLPAEFQLPERSVLYVDHRAGQCPFQVLGYTTAQAKAIATAAFELGAASVKPKKARTTKAKALCPADVPEAVWTDFIALRKAKRAPLTETALKLITKDAEKAGYTLAAALEICCARGWQAFRADWVAPQKSPRGGSLAGMNYGDRNGHFD